MLAPHEATMGPSQYEQSALSARRRSAKEALLMMMYMPWVLAVLFTFLILVVGAPLLAVRMLAAHLAKPDTRR